MGAQQRPASTPFDKLRTGGQRGGCVPQRLIKSFCRNVPDSNSGEIQSTSFIAGDIPPARSGAKAINSPPSAARAIVLAISISLLLYAAATKPCDVSCSTPSGLFTACQTYSTSAVPCSVGRLLAPGALRCITPRCYVHGTSSITCGVSSFTNDTLTAVRLLVSWLWSYGPSASTRNSLPGYEAKRRRRRILASSPRDNWVRNSADMY